MKSVYITILILFLGIAGYGQQEEQFTQFMHNKLPFNPAVAGSEQQAILTGLVRSQWLGMEGAPETQLLSFNMPLFQERVGIGGNLYRQTIGLSENFELNAVYAYRLKMGIGNLRLGLQTSVRLIRSDFSDAKATQAVDQDAAIPPGIESKYVPNFGAGIYYSDLRDQVYVGFAIPRFLQNNIDLADSDGVLSREIQHFYLMGGVKFRLGESIEKSYIQPQVLLKYVKGAPFDADVNVNVFFGGRFMTGLSYRIGGSKSSSFGESVALLLGMDITENLLFGISYDATLSELQHYNNGSIEGMIRYRFGGKSSGDSSQPFDGRDFFNRN